MSEIYKNKQLVNAKSRAKEHSDKTCAESSTENATNIQQFIWAIGPNHLGCTQSLPIDENSALAQNSRFSKNRKKLK